MNFDGFEDDEDERESALEEKLLPFSGDFGWWLEDEELLDDDEEAFLDGREEDELAGGLE